MGIRVHKSLGYGAKDVVPKMDRLKELNDEWCSRKGTVMEWAEKNKNGILAFYLMNFPDIRGQSPEDIWKYSFGLMARFDKDLDAPSRNSPLIHDDEYGLEGVVQFIPVGCRDWERYDNIIDYYEELDEDSCEPRVELVNKCGIYPWIGMVRYRNCPPGIWGNKEAEEKNSLLGASQWSMLTGLWDKEQGPLVDERILKHLREDYRPVLPIELAAVVWFFREAFDNPDELYNSLRPMIYVYWS
jgi:hypothetical protein